MKVGILSACNVNGVDAIVVRDEEGNEMIYPKGHIVDIAFPDALKLNKLTNLIT